VLHAYSTLVHSAPVFRRTGMPTVPVPPEGWLPTSMSNDTVVTPPLVAAV